MHKNTHHRIAYYIRVSTQEQAENPEGSIKNQTERLKEMVEIKNRQGNFGEVVGIYIDRAKSGKDTNRPELQKMLKAIINGEVTLVMASELSRISRNMKDFAEIWDLMKAYDCSFLSLRENFDSTTAAGEMVLFTLANLAQFERRQVSERVSANMNSRASRGLYNGGTVPFGYLLDPENKGTLKVNPESAEVVRACFEAFLEKETLSKAANWLIQRGYRIKRPEPGSGRPGRNPYFTTSSLNRILRNKAYIGIRQYNFQGKPKEVKACWEPIIDAAIFNRVGKMLSRNKSRKKPPSKNRYPYILSGLTRCLYCKDVMNGKSAHGNGGKIGYYEHGWAIRKEACLSKKTLKCEGKTMVPAKKIEPLIWNAIMNLIQGGKLAESIFEKTKHLGENNSSLKQIKSLKNKMKSYSDQLDALAERLCELPKNVSANPIYKQMEKIEKQAEESKEALRNLQTDEMVEKAVSVEAYDSFLKTLRKILKGEIKEETKTKIISKLIHKVEVGNDKIRVHFFVGENYMKQELALRASSLSFGKKGRTNPSPSSLGVLGSGESALFTLDGVLIAAIAKESGIETNS